MGFFPLKSCAWYASSTRMREIQIATQTFICNTFMYAFSFILKQNTEYSLFYRKNIS